MKTDNKPSLFFTLFLCDNIVINPNSGYKGKNHLKCMFLVYLVLF